MSEDKNEEVACFLREVKLTLQASKPDDPTWTLSTARDKNMETLAALEFDLDDVRQVLMSLSTLDYCEGPLKDKGIEGTVWVFGKTVDKCEVYIKLKLWVTREFKQVRVLSFHQAERKIKYYFKK